MRAAIVVDDVITNIIVVDSMDSFAPSEGQLLSVEGVEAGIGWRIVNGVPVEPDPDAE